MEFGGVEISTVIPAAAAALLRNPEGGRGNGEGGKEGLVTLRR